MIEVTELEGAFQFEFAQHDLNALVEHCLHGQRTAAECKQLRLEFALDSALPQIEADEEKLSRAIEHLVDNAVQYTPPCGTIRVRTCRSAGEAIIQISDTGIGINADDLPHIFEQFYRADKARSMSSGGAGLGLFIAKRIVEAHAGRIEAESAIGQGTTFRIRLPLSRQALTAAAQPQPAHPRR
jgi:two-component system sensor histidine kinase BaeS